MATTTPTAAAAVVAQTSSTRDFDKLISSSTSTYKSLQTTSVNANPTSIASPGLVTASGSMPAPPLFSATRTEGGTAPSGTTSNHDSSSSSGMTKNVQHLLIALGCVAGFILVLLTIWVWYRARRQTSTGLFAFCMPKRKSDSYYRQLQSPTHGWESGAAGATERKGSTHSRSNSITPMMAGSPPHTRAVMSPAPARLNSTFIGRERNNLVRASLNRHQLSTLDEHSIYEYKSEPPLLSSSSSSSPSRSLAQQISQSAQNPKPLPSTLEDLPGGTGASPSMEPDPNLAVAPLQLRKGEDSRQNTPSSRATVAQPITPLPGAQGVDMPPPIEFSVPRFRSVDHWADYQDRMARRDRSMTSGEYSQAFKDRDSTADSLGKRDSNSTFAMFRYHPGEEARIVAAREVEPANGAAFAPAHQVHPYVPLPQQTPSQQPIPPPSTVPSPSGSVNNIPSYYESSRQYQPFNPPRRMHSSRKPRAGARHQINGGVATIDRSTSSSSSSSSNSPPSSSSDRGGQPGSADHPIKDGAETVPHHRQVSEATVFRYHPGDEVRIDRADKIKSEDLDALFSTNV